ncbi:MAG: sodium-dependent transporter [Clostridiales bacterium]
MLENNSLKRDGFSSKLGILATTAGSAIGLGNIWKFPYITGTYGGSAFIIVYLLCILLIGLPIMLSEFILGRSSQKNCVGAFKKLAPKTPWFMGGWLSILTTFIIAGFYGIIAGWSLNYIFFSLVGKLNVSKTVDFESVFSQFISNPWQPVLAQIIIMALAGFILISGIKNGIEKYSRILMPLLLIIIILIVIRSLTLDGAEKGLDFLLKPDFSKLNLAAIISALGHAFFSLSLGMGVIMTYGSYIGKENNLMKTTLQVTITDTLIALLAGLAIFPAVFAFNIEPTSGPGLVFITLPNVFSNMPLGNIFEILFFILLTIAALTSLISVLEVIVSFLHEELKWSRKKSTLITIISTTTFGAILSQGNGVLSNFNIPFIVEGKSVNMNIFDWFITLSDQLLPLGGLIVAVFIGWILKDKVTKNECSSNGLYKTPYYSVFKFLIKYITPLLIIFIFLSNIFGLFK